MRAMKRAVHLDFHTMPGINNFGENWDAKAFATILKEAGVGYINAFAKCNLGFAYYPTKIGVPYPAMQGDMFGDLLRECHKKDIGVSAYINVGLDHEQARLHRDWCILNKDGQAIYGDKTENFFRNMCYRSGYRDYLLGITAEVMRNYDADGLFCDCMGLWPCYGNECLEEIAREGLDPLDDENVVNHSKNALIDISREIKKIVGKERYLYLNGNGASDWALKDMDTHIEIECLPSSWSYDFFGHQVAYTRNIQKKVVYMTGRFQKGWGDFGGFKGKSSMESDIWDALSNGADVSIGDHMHPAENLEPAIYQVVGEIYSEVEKLERWTEGAGYMADIGILTGLDSHRLGDIYKGAARMLGELKYSFDIVNEEMDLSGYKVLILPDEMTVTPVLKQKLEKHLLEGKGILSSGEGGLDIGKNGFALEQWRFRYKGPDTSNSSYFHIKEGMDSGMENMKWAMYCHGILMEAEEGTEVIAGYIKPYFNRHWDGFHGYYYTPPEKETEYAAAAMADHVFHICFKIFKAYYTSAMHPHKGLVRYCLEKLLTEPLVKCKGMPSTSRVTLTGKDHTVLLHVKTTYPEVRGRMNIIEEHSILPAGVVVGVRGQFSRVYTAPDRKPLQFEEAGRYTNVTLPQVKGYLMVVFEK